MLDGISNINSYVKTDEAVQKMTQKLSENKDNISKTTSSKSKKNDTRLAAIKRKMRQGKKLSVNDMSYLRKNAPALHQKAARIEKKREEFEQKLKNCDSKDEFDRLRAQVTQFAVDLSDVGSIAPNIDTSQIMNTDMNISSAVTSVNTIQSTNITAITSVSANTNTMTSESNNSNISTDSNQSPQNDSDGKDQSSYENDNTNYMYRSLDDAYRAFKQSEAYRKLPQSVKKNHIGNKINVKV